MPSSPDSTAAAIQPVEGALVGKRVHKYEIIRSIGRGGMGTVYEAINTAIGKRVAMKFVDADLARNKDAIARFHREAQAASAVESAHIVEIFDSGFTDDEIPYLVMELLRGEDLGHRIKRCGRLELGEALHVTAQILRGLRRAHDAGIIHRDLKPDNIFLVDRDDDPNFAKILDFGISKVRRESGVSAHTLTRQGTVLGTPFYMSPEQAQALPDVDGRTDLWAVGAILYECLTGHPPHSGNSYEQVIVNICMKDAHDVRMSNPAVPEPIARVIAKALARDRDQRFSSAREFLDALTASSGGLLPSRGRSSSDDVDAITASSPGATPRTPAHRTPGDTAIGFDPTLEVSGNGSKVGWASSGRAGGRSSRRRALIAVALGSLVAGLAGALLLQARSAPPADARDAAPPSEIAVELRANAADARFTVDGVALSDRTLRGRAGETKRVRIEAAGYMPMDKDVVLQAGSGPIDVDLSPLPAELSATVPAGAPASSASAPADPAAAASAPEGPAASSASAPAGSAAAAAAPAGPTASAPRRPAAIPQKTTSAFSSKRVRSPRDEGKPAASSQAPQPSTTSKPKGVAAGLQLKVE